VAASACARLAPRGHIPIKSQIAVRTFAGHEVAIQDSSATRASPDSDTENCCDAPNDGKPPAREPTRADERRHAERHRDNGPHRSSAAAETASERDQLRRRRIHGEVHLTMAFAAA
jgi:hypothetical protein